MKPVLIVCSLLSLPDLGSPFSLGNNAVISRRHQLGHSMRRQSTFLWSSSGGNAPVSIKDKASPDLTQTSASTNGDVEILVPPSIFGEEEMTKHPTSEKKLTSKAFNGCLLLLSFGFAAYTILHVDDGMTRGWSMPEKAMRIPLDNWSSYESSLNTQPVFTKTTINVVIYLLGDWLSQTLFVKKDLLEFDAWRTMRNGLIGMFFGPLVHQYYEFSDAILPVDVGWNRLYKILMDQTLYLSVKCTVYIVAVNMLAGESWEYSSNSAKEKIKEIMFTAWKFWPLVHCVTYGAIPARHRILWVNCVDLFWNAILALKTSNDGDGEGDNDDSEDGNTLIDSLNDIEEEMKNEGGSSMVQSEIEKILPEIMALVEPIDGDDMVVELKSVSTPMESSQNTTSLL